MRLRAKIILSVVLMLSLLGGLSITFFLHIIRPSFLEFEEGEAVNDMQRVVSAIQNELYHLNSLNHDWAAWNLTHAFMLNRSEEYIKENLPLSSFTDNHLNIIQFYDNSGELFWGEAYDLETSELLHIKDFSAHSLPRDHHLLNFAYDEYPLSEVSITGVWETEHGPLLVSSRPIINNDNEGPVRGTLIMGHFLDSKVIGHLSEQTKVKFDVLSTGLDSTEQSRRNILQMLTPEQPFYFDRNSDDELVMFASLSNIKGNSELLIRAYKEREIFGRSQTVMVYTICSILLSIFLVMVILFLLMQKIVLGPINTITQHVLQTRHSGDLSSHLKIQSNDEIGLLAIEFNLMIDKLHEAKHKLQEQFFQMGMAELASGILHNARNTLHNISSNIEIISKSLEKIPVQKIKMARHEIGTTAMSEERKADLIEFLLSTNRKLLDYISKTKMQVDEIAPLVMDAEIIFMSFEKWSYPTEKVEEIILLKKLILESYQYLQKNYRDSISFIVDLGTWDKVHIKTNRLILLQILINLFTNAAESIGRKKEEQGEIHVTVAIEDKDADQAVHIMIRDNGAGMSKEILQKLFERGYTTKKSNKTGLGLHWCANAVTSMNGKIYAESGGVGLGACFHLIVPKNN